MSSIGSLSSSSYAGTYSSCASSSSSAGRAQQPQRSDPSSGMSQKLFAKLDGDGSGGVDAAELQKALDALSQNGQGSSASSATELLGRLDADGDGGLSQEEFSAATAGANPPPPPPGGGHGGPPPMSTADFARARNGGAAGADGDDDPLMALDSDEDGSVSSAEFGIAEEGDGDDRMKAFFDAVDADADGDGQVTRTEATSFKEQLEARFQQGGGGVTGAPEGIDDAASPAIGFDRQELSVLARLATAQYGAVEGNGTSSSNASSLALAA